MKSFASRAPRLPILAFAATASLCGVRGDASAAVLVGADMGGADLTPANGDYLQGTFTNVGTFTVAPGVTVLVDPGNTLRIVADRALVFGTIDGTGGGAGAGLGGAVASAGVAGSGPGGGGGGAFGDAVHAGGGGGGGHAGTGGQGAELGDDPGGPGGVTYGSALPPTFDQGSGGGGAGSHSGAYAGIGGDGGAGGAAISIEADFGYYGADSVVLADGQDGKTGTADPSYGSSSGGGGSGGTVLLISDYLRIDGLIGARGGDGADCLPGAVPEDGYAHGGGGGGGGRIKLVGNSSLCNTSVNTVDPGTGGESDLTTSVEAGDGAVGTIHISDPGSCCGNNVLEPGEECDDGNLNDGDCCSEGCELAVSGSACTSDGNACTPDVCDGAGTCTHDVEPAAGCLTALKAKFQVSDSATPAKDKLKWQWSNGEAFDQADLGDPSDELTPTTYTLCVYDSSGGMPTFSTSLGTAATEAAWTSKDPKGFQYKDSVAMPSGVTKASLKTGVAGKTKVKLQAAGLNLLLPAPFGATYFQQQTSVTVQLVNSDGTCWTSEFDVADTIKNEADSFKAAVK